MRFRIKAQTCVVRSSLLLPLMASRRAAVLKQSPSWVRRGDTAMGCQCFQKMARFCSQQEIPQAVTDHVRHCLGLAPEVEPGHGAARTARGPGSEREILVRISRPAVMCVRRTGADRGHGLDGVKVGPRCSRVPPWGEWNILGEAGPRAAWIRCSGLSQATTPVAPAT